MNNQSQTLFHPASQRRPNKGHRARHLTGCVVFRPACPSPDIFAALFSGLSALAYSKAEWGRVRQGFGSSLLTLALNSTVRRPECVGHEHSFMQVLMPQIKHERFLQSNSRTNFTSTDPPQHSMMVPSLTRVLFSYKLDCSVH